MSFNIHHGKGTDKQTDLYRIAQVIAKSGADIIGLNEVDRNFSKRSLYEDQIGWLANLLKMKHAFSPSISIASKKCPNERQYGNALLSRYPIKTKKHHIFNHLSGCIEGRSLLDVTVQINKQLFQIHVTHLSLNPYLHNKQTDFIVNHLQNHLHPTIIMGDCNMKPGSPHWRKLTHEFQDAWLIGGKGAGYTYPSTRPRKRLDYIFVSRNLKVLDAIIETKIPYASDHLPLTVTLSYESKNE